MCSPGKGNELRQAIRLGCLAVVAPAMKILVESSFRNVLAAKPLSDVRYKAANGEVQMRVSRRFCRLMMWTR